MKYVIVWNCSIQNHRWCKTGVFVIAALIQIYTIDNNILIIRMQNEKIFRQNDKYSIFVGLFRDCLYVNAGTVFDSIKDWTFLSCFFVCFLHTLLVIADLIEMYFNAFFCAKLMQQSLNSCCELIWQKKQKRAKWK